MFIQFLRNIIHSPKQAAMLGAALFIFPLEAYSTSFYAAPDHPEPHHQEFHHYHPGPVYSNHQRWFWASRHHANGPSLPEAATFAIISGITYAVINGAYYRHEGERYIWVSNQPPAQNTTIIVNDPNRPQVTESDDEPNGSSGDYTLGSIVEELPDSAKEVSINDRQYFVSHHHWFIALEDQGYVVVKSPL
ncbi:DUF6515 family protein [Celerinatantimonas sp. YJH-8]|uniref:DUF6515 family protein n=1 Tax=Celerinatantimonas sp. YJH-8 TaxID=3228714 RepID=UPI0038C7F56B